VIHEIKSLHLGFFVLIANECYEFHNFESYSRIVNHTSKLKLIITRLNILALQEYNEKP
jgi:hypothetical protein